MSMMGLPLQAHTNVRDVLAPLFCNGRSFSSLIDELSRHFKFEQISSDAPHDDTTGALEASSESQSTDSEAEGNASDEADDRLIQARVSAQARSSQQRTASKGAAPPPPFSTTPDPPPLDPSATFAAAGGLSQSAERRGDVSSAGVRGRVTTPVATPTPTSAPMGEALPSTRRTRSRSRQQQQQQQQKQQQKQRQQKQKKQKQQQQQQQQTEPSSASTSAPPSDEAGGRRVTRGNATTTNTTTAPPTTTTTRTPRPPPPTTTTTGSGIGTNNVNASAATGSGTSTTSGSTGGGGGGDGGRGQEGAEGTFFWRDVPTPTGTSQGTSAPVGGGAAASASAAPPGASGASTRVGNGSGSSAGSGSSSGCAVGAGINSKGFISGDVLTVLSVTVNADGWSEAVGAALATRARAGYVFAQEVDPDSPQSSEFVREVFLDERSGARKALEVRIRLIPVSQKVLLCSAWVDSGEYLAAAARLVARCQAEVFGIACVRFEQNRSTQGLVNRFNLYAKSMPKGSVPSLNVGMKSCIPASLTKGFHGYTYNRGATKGSGVWAAFSSSGSKLGSSSADGGGEKASGVGGASGGGGRGSPSPAAGAEVRHDRARKRRRSRCAGVSRSADAAGGRSPPVSPEVAAAEAAAAAAEAAAEAAAAATEAAAMATAAAVATLEPMEDEKGGLPAGAAADEVSAGEEVAEPGDGGQPAQRFGGGGVSEGTGGGGAEGIDGVGGGVEGGRRWGRLLGGESVMFVEEEGDYAADSERSTDHESMHLCGGGLRESDEHDTSEREGFRRSAENGGAVAGPGADGAGGLQDRGRNSTRTAGYRGGGVRSESRTSSPEAGLGGDDGGNSSGRNSTSAGGEGRSRVGTSSLKRRRVGSASSSGGSDCGGSGDGVRVGGVVQDEAGGQGELHAHGEASHTGGSVGVVGGGEEMEEEEEEEEEEERERDEVGVEAVETRALAVGGLAVGMGTTGTPLEWKAKLGRQPIFMSRGIPEKGRGLLSHSEGETHGTGSAGRGGIGALSGPVQDPEDDPDRASSCSSADSPVPSSIRAGGSIIVRPGSRGGGRAGVGLAGAAADDGRGIHSDTAAAIGRGVAVATATAAAAASAAEVGAPRVAKAPPPNTPGGAVPWHHTSVYEANDPTEDRHAEATHSALGVRIYCVCDGHGGSRAAQFVCDHLAGDVLARVVVMAAAARERGGPGSDDGWTGNEQEVRRSLADAFTSCDEQFIAQLDPRKNRGYINAGCCVLLALLIRSKLYVAHVGDCRIVLGTTDAGPARFPPNFLSTASTTVTATGAVAAVSAAAAAAAAAVAGSGRDGPLGRESGGVRGGSVTPPGGRRAGCPTRSSPGGGLGAVALSRDHNCDDADEVALVRARSGDEKAIRVSRNDQYKGARAIKRVAGSLAVTRAIGDAYLKKAAFSFTPYKEGVPYITAEPAVTALDLTSSDRFLVLATDGVWEQISNDEAVRCVSAAVGLLDSGGDGRGGDGGGGGAGATPRGSSPAMSRRQRGATDRVPAEGGRGGATGAGAAAPAVTSDALVDYVLARSAQGHGMSVSSLRALPRGPPRRMLHDDVCVTVVHLTPAQRQ